MFTASATQAKLITNSAGVAPTGGQKIKAHYRKWWWAHIIGFLLFALVLIIVVIYGIIPPVAQRLIDKTTLTVNSLSILEPTPNSFKLSINATIRGATGPAAHARIEQFNVKLFLEENGTAAANPILEMPVPEMHGGGDMAVIQNNVPIRIADTGALDEFAKKLLAAFDMRIRMRGRTTIWLGAIHAGVNYNELVTLRALNDLQGIAITTYSFLSNDPRGNIGGDVMIPNPTVTTIEMGDVGLVISSNKTELGTGVIPNLVLKPGNHTYQFVSAIQADKLLQLASAASLGGGLSISSNGTSVGGVKIPWLSKPLEALDTLVPVSTG